MVAAARDGANAGSAAVEVVPRLRGRLHLWAGLAALPAGVWLVLRAAPGMPQVVVGGYAAATCLMLFTSAAYHRCRWSASTRRVVAGLDRCLIFVALPAGATPWALQPGVPWARTVLLVVWAGVFIGVAAQVPRMATGWVPPRWCRARWLAVLPYFALGTPIVVAVAALALHVGPVASLLVGTAALVLGAGALAYAARRPNPFPGLFGHHELFHASVIAALALNAVALALYVLPHP